VALIEITFLKVKYLIESCQAGRTSSAVRRRLKSCSSANKKPGNSGKFLG